jgi:hypothetical protein
LRSLLIEIALILAVGLSTLAQTAKPTPTPAPAKKEAPEAKPLDAIALTEGEVARGQQLAAAEAEARQIVEAAGQAAASAPIAAQSATEAVGNLKAASLQFQLIQTRRQLWEAQVRLAHDCARCDLSEDRKSLIRPKPPDPQPDAKAPPK